VDKLPANVISLDARRRTCAQAPRQVQADRGYLFVNIQDNGKVDYGVNEVATIDMPAMIMACLIMCMKFVRQIDDAALQ
jgi:hypothetical protein